MSIEANIFFESVGKRMQKNVKNDQRMNMDPVMAYGGSYVSSTG